MALAQHYAGLVDRGHYTKVEYFEFERTSQGRWEYVEGEIRQMACGSDDHNTIASNLARCLGNALVPRGCRVYGSDMKVHTGDGVNTFPDVSVVCGERQYYLGKTDVILNPLLVTEVVSPSTQAYDRGEKFHHYQTIESLLEYLLVEQDKPRVTLYTRQADHWEFREINGLEGILALTSVEVTLALRDIFALIEWETETR